MYMSVVGDAVMVGTLIYDWALARVTVNIVFLARHLTLTVPLSTQEYKLTGKLLAGQPIKMLGSNPLLD